MTEKGTHPYRRIGTGIAIILTLGAYFFLIAWIWKSPSLTRLSAYDAFGLLTAILSTAILGVLYYRYWKTGDEKYSILVFGLVIAGIWLFLILPLGSLAYLATSPGSYDYSVTIAGLDHYTGGLTTDIIVPLPVEDGKPLVPEDELQYRRFGTWTSLLVMTREGKMLAFQTGDENLTDIHARFPVPLDGPIPFMDISRYSLSPVINQTGNPARGQSTGRQGTSYTTQVFISKGINPVLQGNNTITIQLELAVQGGMSFGRSNGDYLQTVSARVPEGTYGWIPVTVGVSPGSPAYPPKE